MTWELSALVFGGDPWEATYPSADSARARARKFVKARPALAVRFAIYDPSGSLYQLAEYNPGRSWRLRWVDPPVTPEGAEGGS